MPEFETSTPSAADRQLEALVTDVESKLIAAEDAMSDLRHAIRQLKSYRPAPAASSAAWQAPVPAPSPPAAQQATNPDEATRQEVSRIVSETRAELTAPGEARPRLHQETVGIPFWPGPKQEEVEEKKDFVQDYGLDSTSEASWPVARAAQTRPEPAAHVEAPGQDVADAPAPDAVSSATDEDPDDAARREEVARLVAQIREGDDEADEFSPDAPQDDDARRSDVARIVADLRDSIDVEAVPPLEGEAESNGYEQAGGHDELAEAVAEAWDDETKREDVASMVARMRAELSGGDDAPEGAVAVEGEAADAEVRDEVRRAVEAARAEMASGYKESAAESGEKRFSFPDWQTTHMEPSGPPVIVIKDTEGRVELARVYETLSRVHCDENAALLNYTPHSVTVGLNAKAPVPEVEAMREAIQSVFGRVCEVDSDGVRVNVQIGRDVKGKDSAA